MQSLALDLFSDPALEAGQELMCVGDTGTGTSTSCTSTTWEAEVEWENDGVFEVEVGACCNCVFVP